MQRREVQLSYMDIPVEEVIVGLLLDDKEASCLSIEKSRLNASRRSFDKVGTAPKSTDSIAPQQFGGGYAWLEMSGLGGIGKSCILDEVKAQCRDYSDGKGLPFVNVDFLTADVESGADNRIDFLTRVCDQLDKHYPGASVVRGSLRSSVKASGAHRISGTLCQNLRFLPRLNVLLEQCRASH